MTGQLPYTILNVNDEDHVRYGVSRILRKANFRVEEVSTGRGALQMALRGVDLIVLDVQLPDLDGFEVCRRLRQDPRTASIPVIHLSAHHIESEDRSLGLETGSDSYLVQPVEPRELVATVQAMLRIRQAESEARTLARQWQVTFDGIRDNLCLLSADGQLLRCNRAMAHFLGRSAAELIGCSYRDLLLARLGPEAEVLLSLPETDRHIAEYTLGGHWYRVTTDRIQESGHNLSYVQIVVDITEQKKAAETERDLRNKTLEVERLQQEMSRLERLTQRFSSLAETARSDLAPPSGPGSSA